MSTPNSSPDCMAAAVDGLCFDNPLSAHQASVLDAVGVRTQEGGRIFPRCLNSLDPEIGCRLAVKSASFVGNCALGKEIVQAEGPGNIKGVYREPWEGLSGDTR